MEVLFYFLAQFLWYAGRQAPPLTRGKGVAQALGSLGLQLIPSIGDFQVLALFDAGDCSSLRASQAIEGTRFERQREGPRQEFAKHGETDEGPVSVFIFDSVWNYCVFLGALGA